MVSTSVALCQRRWSSLSTQGRQVCVDMPERRLRLGTASNRAQLVDRALRFCRHFRGGTNLECVLRQAVNIVFPGALQDSVQELLALLHGQRLVVPPKTSRHRYRLSLDFPTRCFNGGNRLEAAYASVGRAAPRSTLAIGCFLRTTAATRRTCGRRARRLTPSSASASSESLPMEGIMTMTTPSLQRKRQQHVRVTSSEPSADTTIHPRPWARATCSWPTKSAP